MEWKIKRNQGHRKGTSKLQSISLNVYDGESLTTLGRGMRLVSGLVGLGLYGYILRQGFASLASPLLRNVTILTVIQRTISRITSLFFVGNATCAMMAGWRTLHEWPEKTIGRRLRRRLPGDVVLLIARRVIRIRGPICILTPRVLVAVGSA